MSKKQFQELPKIRDSISFLYFQYGHVEQSKLGVEFSNLQGRALLPVASLCALMLGPGTTVTHAAVKALTESGCSIIWCGEEGVRCYAQGIGETHKSYRLMHQAALSSDPEKRLVVIEKMYRARFPDDLPPNMSLEQIRGKEGIRVREAYAKAAKKYGIVWNGRSYDRSDWKNSDAPNRALSAANACLHGLVHAAILSAGYAPALGFIHQGKQLSFAYDVADLYKASLTVPVAFATAAESPAKLESEVRKRCRNAFVNCKLLSRIVHDIDKLLTINKTKAPEPDGFDPDSDPALPTPWWDDPDPEKRPEFHLFKDDAS
jgi:CRISPR-associated protein Cas1